MRVPASGGTPVPITRDGGKRQRYPWFLPDGRHFLYATAQGSEMTIQVGSLDEPDKAASVVAQAQSPAMYAEGHLLFLRGRTVLAQAFDLKRRRRSESRSQSPNEFQPMGLSRGSRVLQCLQTAFVCTHRMRSARHN